MLRVLEAERGILEVYNMGAEDAIDVDAVAKVVSEQMNLTHVEFSHTGGVDGGRGWIGDVKQMWLDISKLKALGWSPRYSSSEAIREATRMLTSKV
jgi:UDP-glucose 4-epimerase